MASKKPPRSATGNVATSDALAENVPWSICRERVPARVPSQQVGMANGETCLIELFGLPAKDLITGEVQRSVHFTPVEVEAIRHKRIVQIQRRLLGPKPPDFVVLYGYSALEHWKTLAHDCALVRDDIALLGSIKIAFVKHPSAPNREGDAYWQWIGERLRLGKK